MVHTLLNLFSSPLALVILFGEFIVLANVEIGSCSIYRVSSDLENLEMPGNFDVRRKSQGKVREFLKTRKVREKPKPENFIV